MKKMYFCVSSFDSTNLLKGTQVVHQAIQDGFESEIRTCHAVETNLFSTGWASQSFNLLAYGSDKEAVEKFVSDLAWQFNEIAKEESVDEDCENDEEVLNLIEYLFEYVHEHYGALNEFKEIQRSMKLHPIVERIFSFSV